MKTVIPAFAFVARHFLFVMIAMIAGCVLWTVAYIVLFAVALLGDQGLGGPLAFPAGIVTVIATGVFLGWGIFTPASAIGAAFCGLLKLPKIAAIPVVFGGAFLFSYLLYWGYIELVTTQSMLSVWVVLKNFAISLSIPLGVYWWLTEGPGALFDGFRRWIRRRRARNTVGE